MKKIILRFLTVIVLICVCFLTNRYLKGELDSNIEVVLYFIYFALAINIILKVQLIRQQNNLLANYEESYNSLKILHKTRYRLYLSINYDKEKIEKYTELIDMKGNILLVEGNNIIQNAFLNEGQIFKIKTIQSKIEELLKNIQTEG